MTRLFSTVAPHAWGVLGGLFGLSFAGSAPAIAAGSGEDAKAGLPQFDPATLTEQVFWLVVLFALFYFLMARVALPRLTAVLESRQSRIDADLDQAQKLKAEAEKALHEFEALMADARAKAQEIHSEARQKITAHSAQRQAAVEAQLAQEAQDAEARISKAVDAAMSDVKAVSAEIAAEMTEKLVGLKVDDAAAQAAAAAASEGAR